MNKSVIDNYVQYFKQFKPVLDNYFRQFGVDCQLLVIDKTKDDDYLKAYGVSQTGYGIEDDRYLKIPSWIIFDPIEYYQLGLKMDPQGLLYISASTEVTVGTRIQLMKSDKLFTYEIDDPLEEYLETLFRVNLKLIGGKDVKRTLS